MTRDAPKPYLDPYHDAVREHGAGFDALLWRSPDAQLRRFRAITRVAPLRGRVVADIGCGNADLLLDLHQRGHEPARYIGIDGVPEMVEHARANARSAGIDAAVFVQHDFVADLALPGQLADDAGVRVFVFSGSLNTLAMGDAQAVLERFWSAAARHADSALVFNFLSDRHDRERTPASPPAVRYDPVAMLDWALDKTPMVRLHHDYLAGHDATICMRTPKPR